MTERPHLNPHRDRELQVGRAADRFEAGPSTVKAARIDPVVTRGRMAALGAGAWQSFKDWRSMQGNPSPYGTYGKERYRPPPILADMASTATTGTPFMYSNDHNPTPGIGVWRLDPRYSYDGSLRRLEIDIEDGDFMSADDFVQEWNSYNASSYNASTS